MAKMDKFLIAPFETGLQTNMKPWLIMDDAFEFLQNCYVFRGRVRKRFGSALMGLTPLNSRLRVPIGTTDGAGDLAFTQIPGDAMNGLVLNEGSLFSAGNIQFTVDGVPSIVGTALTLSTDLGPGGPAVGTVKLVSTAPNIYQFQISGSQAAIATTIVYWYPSTPVMGICQYAIGPINNHPTYAFDLQFAYTFSSPSWSRSGTAVWHGTDTNFFWTCNWQGSSTMANTGTPVLFVTNFNSAVPAPIAATDDPIWYTANGSTWVALKGDNAFYFAPGGGAIQTGPFVSTAKIIVAFKNRLVLLNTIENNNGGSTANYVNRCRYSINGSPFATNAWYEPNQTDMAGNVAAGAGYIDASTEEQIITAEFIKDRLIVYFERSTWELAYTGNEILPFVWQKINTELGSQSTFSTVAFDKQVLTVGNTGIHACNGSNVQRIDDKIPDEVFEFRTENNAELRICGIRDFEIECVYWAFVADTSETTQKYPNQVLVYNYKNNSWAINDDCFTAFGYYEQQTDLTWQDSAPTTWQQANQTWDSQADQALFREILGGTPEGFMLILESEYNTNAPSMQITNITFNGDGTLTLYIINHNLSDTDDDYEAFGSQSYISLANIVADATTQSTLNGAILPVTVVDEDNVIIDTRLLATPPLITGDYYGGGTAALVSNVQLLTKQFNPYDKENTDVYVSQINFAVQRTFDGEITVDYYSSSAENSMINDGISSTAIMGNNILETSPYDPTLYPFESQQARLWHPIYFQSIGECIQIGMYLSPAQMMNYNISGSAFVLEGMLLVTQRADRRLQ